MRGATFQTLFRIERPHVKGNDNMTTASDLALLAKLVYERDKTSMSGWDMKKNWGKFSGYGFYAEAYVSKNDNWVLSIRGSQDKRDYLVDDLQIAINALPLQMKDALDAYYDFIKLPKKSPTFITGHSLGGGLAQLLAAQFTVRTVTFNAPGMAAQANVPSRNADSYRHIHNVRANRDVVSLKGKHLGDVESVELNETWARNVQWCAVGIIGAAAISGGVGAIPAAKACITGGAASTIANQHSIDTLAATIYTIPRFHQPLKAIA